MLKDFRAFILRGNVVDLAVAVVLGTHAFAHENFRVIGMLTKHQNSRIDVRNREGRTISILAKVMTAAWWPA